MAAQKFHYRLRPIREASGCAQVLLYNATGCVGIVPPWEARLQREPVVLEDWVDAAWSADHMQRLYDFVGWNLVNIAVVRPADGSMWLTIVATGEPCADCDGAEEEEP